MSSQKGNVARSRPQKHQNTFSFKNDKFDKSVQTKKINAKLHDGVCQRCKEVLEWRVKYSKYKPLSKPKKWFNKEPEKAENPESNLRSNHRSCRRNQEESDDDLDFGIDLDDTKDNQVG
ncbi:uncharacterized protein C9orf85 homolog isoform X3 [Lutra lutra]|uniref:uncharacterized protein C9orf85 homolog isoform X3 n=1 Tax=Lutra lutra TaxID=9657 RepID=UPI001FD10921|nr:uncharacterized protein C9orf85 homolog isoform X3 [Lutra lutra]